MRKRLSMIGPWLACSVLLLSAPMGLADSYSGKLNGHGCAHAGKTCPTDRLDPHVALEPDFVLQTGDGDYYFLSNVPREVKVRHALQSVDIEGNLDEKYRSIKVNELRVDGKTVWSLKMQQAEWDHLHNEWWFSHN